jgi:predicted component of type VI protein secretion system
MHDVSLAGAPARDDARARTTTAADDALSVRLDALQRAVDDALETFSTRLRNVKDAVSADANKATQLARASRRELEEMANALDAMTERHERRIEALERAVKAERKALVTRDADDRVARHGDGDIDSAVKRSKMTWSTRENAAFEASPEACEIAGRGANDDGDAVAVAKGESGANVKRWTPETFVMCVGVVVGATTRVALALAGLWAVFWMAIAAAVMYDDARLTRDVGREIAGQWLLFRDEILALMS